MQSGMPKTFIKRNAHGVCMLAHRLIYWTFHNDIYQRRCWYVDYFRSR